MNLASRRAQRVRFLVFRWLGEHIEKPAVKMNAKRLLNKRGYVDFDIAELNGQSDMYTWVVTSAICQPRFVLKMAPAFGIRQRWRQRKASRLFDQMGTRDRIRFINKQIRAFGAANHGARSLSDVDDHVALCDWIVGSSLDQSELSSEILEKVGEVVLTLNKRGLHHGDLHAGNVLIDSDGGVVFIDSDNKFASDIDERTALAVDLATLLGSMLMNNQIDGIENDSSILIDSVLASGDESLMSDIRRVLSEYRLENRWLSIAAEKLLQ